jgi:uncharacterized membrane protein HdeD (DUF308 family)
MATQVDAKRLSGALALRGIVAILFGIAAVFWPGITLVTLVYLFSAFILATGLVTLITGLVDASQEKNSVLSQVLPVVIGVVEIGVGIYLLRHTDVAFDTLILLIGFVLVLRGLVEVFGGLFEDAISGMFRTASVLVGALAVIAGIVLLFQPESGGIAFVWILGLYALLAGPLLVALALDVSKS